MPDAVGLVAAEPAGMVHQEDIEGVQTCVIQKLLELASVLFGGGGIFPLRRINHDRQPGTYLAEASDSTPASIYVGSYFVALPHHDGW